MPEDSTGFFANKSAMLGTALVLVLLSLFLINWGVRGTTWLYWVGVGLLVLGLLLAPLSRFTAGNKAEEESGREKASEEEGKDTGTGKREGN
jgi:phosphotransferase system  glucose/maltose/N-acetylglucosamine-specific IIC component